MRGETIADPATWDQALRSLPHPHLLQSWEWGAFKGRHGWQPTYWLFREGGAPKAAALVLHRQASPLPFSVLYVPKGPILDYGDLPVLEGVLGHLEAFARRVRAIFVKIDPDVRTDTAEGEAVVALLRQRGWRLSPEQVQFRNTMVLDLRPNEEALLAAMKSKWRYNIRLARRKGVTVRQGGLEDLPLLYQMYEETAHRDGFVIRPFAYYQDAWGRFIQAGLAQPLIAEYEGEPLAMVILFRFGGRAWYLYGASRSRHRNRMPNHLLQWEAIRWAKRQGCLEYDLWGAPDRLDEDDPMWGVYRFKQGFGGTFVPHIGAYDYPARPLLYRLYTTVMPRLLAWMRWRHWRKVRERRGRSEIAERR